MIHYSSFCKIQLSLVTCREMQLFHVVSPITWLGLKKHRAYDTIEQIMLSTEKGSVFPWKKSISSFLKICSIFLVLLGFFVAFLISIAYKQVGIGALIAAWLIAMAIIGVAVDYRHPQSRPAEKRKRLFPEKFNAVKRVHIKFHMSTYHLAGWRCNLSLGDSVPIQDWKRHLLWTVPLVLVQPSREQGNTYKGDYWPSKPRRSIVAAWES